MPGSILDLLPGFPGLFPVAAALGLALLAHAAAGRLGGRGLPGLARFAVRSAAWTGFVLYASGRIELLRMLRMALSQVLSMSLTAPLVTVGARSVSALDLVALPALLATMWLAVGFLTRALQTRIRATTGAGSGLDATVGLLARLTLGFLGAILVLQLWGIDVRSLAIAASVLGVGAGFGLQNLANNFVSGVVLGIERPIKPGDFVKVGELAGTVVRIGARSTEILTLDRVSIVVPNSHFLEKEVVNWSHGDPVSRLHVPVGVAYGSDLRRVTSALLEAARGHREVLPDPRPRVELRAFGESALEFELLVWIREPRNQFRLRADLNHRIDAAFRRYGVTIPFPQRDLHLRSPEIGGLVAAWGREVLGVTAAAHGNGNGAAAPWPAGEPEPGPREWDDGELEGLAARMRGPGGVDVRERRHHFVTYPACFVGSEAVEWLMRAESLAREEAVDAGRLLVERGFARHVLDEHPFRDGHYFYRFQEEVP